MTEAERAPYVHRAKAEKNSGTTNVREGRRDNQGELLSVSKTCQIYIYIRVLYSIL